MTEDDLQEIFDREDSKDYKDWEHGKFEKIVNKFSNRPDLHAFILLDKLVPSTNDEDIIVAAEHDEIYLSTNIEEFLKVATEADVIDLMRCGVRYQNEGFCMFA